MLQLATLHVLPTVRSSAKIVCTTDGYLMHETDVAEQFDVLFVSLAIISCWRFMGVRCEFKHSV
jgi:hypothetical protein